MDFTEKVPVQRAFVFLTISITNRLQAILETIFEIPYNVYIFSVVLYGMEV